MDLRCRCSFVPNCRTVLKSWAATDGKGTVTLKVVPTVEVSGGLSTAVGFVVYKSTVLGTMREELDEIVPQCRLVFAEHADVLYHNL